MTVWSFQKKYFGLHVHVCVLLFWLSDVKNDSYLEFDFDT